MTTERKTTAIRNERADKEQQGQAMTQQLTFVILSTGLDTFRELRGALSTQEGARVLAGGDDAEQVFPEIERLRPSAVIVAFGSTPENELRFAERVARECPQVAVLRTSPEPPPHLLLRALRPGARQCLRLAAHSAQVQRVYRRNA